MPVEQQNSGRKDRRASWGGDRRASKCRDRRTSWRGDRRKHGRENRRTPGRRDRRRSLPRPPFTPAVFVRAARTIAEVEAIREIWTAWKGHRDSDIDFCLKYVWSAKEFIRPHVMVLYRDGRPDALLVGRLDRVRMKFKIGYVRFPGIQVRLLTIAYGGFRGNTSPENSEALVLSIMNELGQGEADAALFHQLSEDLPLYEKVLRLPGFASRDHRTESAPHSVTRLSGGLENVLLGLSSKHRKDLRRIDKKIAAHFKDKVTVWCFREPSQVEAAIPLVEEVAKKTYQRGLGVGFEDTEHMRQYLDVSARKGWSRIHLLSLGDIPCAFSVGTLYQGCFCSDHLGFDPQFGNYSPGTFLLVKTMEELCDDGVNEIDWGIGEGLYKERFGNHCSMESSVYIFAPSMKGWLLNAVRIGTGWVDSNVKRLLQRTNLLATIKKYWRRRLTKSPGPALPEENLAQNQ